VDFIDRLDPELVRAITSPHAIDIDFSAGVDGLRRLMTDMREQMKGLLPDITDVKTRDVFVAGYAEGHPEVVVRVYEPDVRLTEAPLYWIHGGGMVAGAYDGDDFQSKTFASKFGCVVVSVEYRLAPEYPYPAPLHDCYAGLRWLHAEAETLGCDPARIVIAGASAGGGLAAGLALMARDVGQIPIAAQILIYPMIDDRDATVSNREITYKKVWHREANVFGWSSYLADRYGTPDVPLYAAPARATVDDLRGLPPAYIDVGELDPFRDEDIEYAQKLLAAGVPCELLVTPGAFHASEGYNPEASSSKRITRSRMDAIGRALGAVRAD
jgi:acetyl esterase/lipase